MNSFYLTYVSAIQNFLPFLPPSLESSVPVTCFQHASRVQVERVVIAAAQVLLQEFDVGHFGSPTCNQKSHSVQHPTSLYLCVHHSNRSKQMQGSIYLFPCSNAQKNENIMGSSKASTSFASDNDDDDYLQRELSQSSEHSQTLHSGQCRCSHFSGTLSASLFL